MSTPKLMTKTSHDPVAVPNIAAMHSALVT